MILVIDVGNTNIVIGIYRGKKLMQYWRLSTNRSTTDDEYGMLMLNLFLHAGVERGEIEGVMISSVVPPLVSIMERACTKYVGKRPLLVGPGIKTGLNIMYENPRDVGADRIVNAIAAIDLYGAPLIIIDFGTATTFCYVNEKSQYLGGAIVPGIQISTEALYQRAAKLPRIELVRPKSTIGRNPTTSMQAGVIYGYAAQVDGMVERIEREFKTHATIIATGELAELIAEESRSIHKVNPHLTLEGLRILYERNKD